VGSGTVHCYSLLVAPLLACGVEHSTQVPLLLCSLHLLLGREQFSPVYIPTPGPVQIFRALQLGPMVT
jgi:hypothetical protein